MPRGEVKSCVFCQIAEGKAEAHVVMEGEGLIAFLDKRPLFPGHVLLIPRNHFETIVDLPFAEVPAFFHAAQRLARAVQGAMRAEGTFLAINNRVSQSVPHLHLHVVPRVKGDGLRGFFWPRQAYPSEAAMAEAAEAIRQALNESTEERVHG